MPRTTNWASAKTPPTRQQRQTTHLGELDTTPTRPDASPGLFTKDTPQNGVYEQSIRLNKDSDAFEDGLEDGDLVELVDTTKHTPQNGVYEQSIRLNKDSDAFEDGLEDGDLVELVDTQAVPNATVSKDFPWSETGSGARRSSSVSSGGASKSPFGYLGADNVFSSPASGSDAPPDTVPLPLGLLHDPLLEEQRQGHMIVDFSETATTMIRSSPVTESHLSKSLGTSSHRGFAEEDDMFVAQERQNWRSFLSLCGLTLLMFLFNRTTESANVTGKLIDAMFIMRLMVFRIWAQLVLEVWRGDNRY